MQSRTLGAPSLVPYKKKNVNYQILKAIHLRVEFQSGPGPLFPELEGYDMQLIKTVGFYMGIIHK